MRLAPGTQGPKQPAAAELAGGGDMRPCTASPSQDSSGPACWLTHDKAPPCLQEEEVTFGVELRGEGLIGYDSITVPGTALLSAPAPSPVSWSDMEVSTAQQPAVHELIAALRVNRALADLESNPPLISAFFGVIRSRLFAARAHPRRGRFGIDFFRQRGDGAVLVRGTDEGHSRWAPT